ncbi:uncharacterized protein LOC144145108 [Haemaphysalis longicornis]
MIALLSLLVLCIFKPMAAKAEVCGGNSGPPCNISLVYAAFQTAYLDAITPNITQDCVVLVREENNKNTITLYFKNGTVSFAFTETYTFTGEPDLVNITVDTDASKHYQYKMLYADSKACFVLDFNPAHVGCRLWMFENATSSQITACREVHAEACPGTIYYTWDEESCPSILEGA